MHATTNTTDAAVAATQGKEVALLLVLIGSSMSFRQLHL